MTLLASEWFFVGVGAAGICFLAGGVLECVENEAGTFWQRVRASMTWQVFTRAGIKAGITIPKCATGTAHGGLGSLSRIVGEAHNGALPRSQAAAMNFLGRELRHTLPGASGAQPPAGKSILCLVVPSSSSWLAP